MYRLRQDSGEESISKCISYILTGALKRGLNKQFHRFLFCLWSAEMPPYGHCVLSKSRFLSVIRR